VSTPFPQSEVEKAWARAASRSGYPDVAQCECQRTSHGHSGRCPEWLVKSGRGKEGKYGWEAHHINANGPAVASNCEILCQSCHKGTGTYGGH